MINCGPADSAEEALAEMASVTSKPLGVYPNKMLMTEGHLTATARNQQAHEVDLPLGKFKRLVADYMSNDKVRFIGGCCHIYDDFVAGIREVVDKQEEKVKRQRNGRRSM